MFDEMDRYLSTSLSNWVAKQPFPGNVKSALLEKAAKGQCSPPPAGILRVLKQFYCCIAPGYLNNSRKAGAVFEPMDFSNRWSHNLILTSRLAF